MFDYTVAMADTPRGRGTGLNPANRFEEISVEWDESADPAERPDPKTRFLRDSTRSILVKNDSPDVPFNFSMNPYRGCEHGCSYCFARPYHEYLGLSAGLDFETMIFVKENAPALLEREFARPSWEPQVVAMSGVTDVYQPVERRLELTRRCLQVFADCRNPVGLITKNSLIERDVDVLAELARFGAVRALFSITTLDAELARRMEPRAATPSRRLEAMRTLAKAGVPVGVMAAPMIPGLNDHEMPKILEASADAGAETAAYTLLGLPYAVKDVFLDWLEKNYPDRRDKVVSQTSSLRDDLGDPRIAARMRGRGAFADALEALFRTSCRRFGLNKTRRTLDAESFRRPLGAQLRLL